jgi:hypothetical protein
MTMREFIRSNREALVEAINSVVGRVPATASCYCPKSRTDHQHEPPKLTNEDRRQWVLNDEGLYRWARSEGVRI